MTLRERTKAKDVVGNGKNKKFIILLSFEEYVPTATDLVLRYPIGMLHFRALVFVLLECC